MREIRLNFIKGFSLVELMIATVLSIFLIGGAVVLATSGTSAAGNSERLARAQENLRFVSNFLIQELRTTGAFPFVTEPGTFLEITNGGGSILVRYEAEENCLGQDTAATSGLAVNTYSLSGNELTCDGGQGTSGALLEGISLLEFTQIDGPSGQPIGVNVQLQLEDDPFPDLVYEFTVAFRNPVLRVIGSSSS